MADETQNSTGAQLSSGASSLVNGIWGALKDSESSWRGLIGLALILTFILVYSGKWPAKSEAPKANNSEVLSALADIKTDIAQLKAKLESTGGELGKQLDELETKTTAIVAPIKRVKPKALPESP